MFARRRSVFFTFLGERTRSHLSLVTFRKLPDAAIQCIPLRFAECRYISIRGRGILHLSRDRRHHHADWDGLPSFAVDEKKKRKEKGTNELKSVLVDREVRCVSSSLSVANKNLFLLLFFSILCEKIQKICKEFSDWKNYLKHVMMILLEIIF